ncbi:MAG: hydrolase [Thermodesulfovibrionales bacterium]|jgi:nicotinamidase-related amidase
MDKYLLSGQDAALIIVDIQDRLAAAMKQRDEVIGNCLHLIELARMVRMPLIVTEQYPKGLGQTVPELREALSSCEPVEKLAFNCCEEAAFRDRLRETGRKTVIITGMETHICVLQTCLGLLREGYHVHVVRDAVCSRNKENRDTGLAFMRDAGAVITCTETALFQILRVSGTEEFKAISRRIK